MTFEADVVELAISLGFHEGEVYHISITCNDALNALINFLKSNDSILDRYLAFYNSNIINDDLIPLICCNSNDTSIIRSQFELMYLLTLPSTKILIDEEISKEKFNQYLELIQAQIDVREAIGNSQILSVITLYLRKFLVENKTMKSVINLCLQIIINIFNEEHASRIASNHNISTIFEKLLRTFFSSNLDKVVLFLGNSEQHSKWSFVILNLLFNLLSHINPYTLYFDTKDKISSTLSQSIGSLLKEERKKHANRVTHKLARHPNFGGVLVKVTNETHETVLVNPKGDISQYSTDRRKNITKKSQKQFKKQLFHQYYQLPNDLDEILVKFLSTFLSFSFKNVYANIQDFRFDVDKSEISSHYLWYLSFFLLVNRIHQCKIEQVGCAINIDTFNNIYHSITKAIDSLDIDKHNVSKYIHDINNGLVAYDELYQYLNIMQSSSDSILNHASEIITENVLYSSEHKDIFLTIFKRYRRDHFPLQFLQNLFISFSSFFQSLQIHYKKRGLLNIQIKRRRVGGKSKKEKLIPKWDEIYKELKHHDCIQSSNINDSVFNDEILVESKLFAIKNEIAEFLAMKNYEKAINLYYQIINFTGKENISTEEVQNGLQRIYDNYFVNDNFKDDPEEHQRDDYEGEKVIDKSIDLNKYMTRYACMAVGKVLAHLLKYHHVNKESLNESIFVFIEYIAFELEYIDMFYHISFFRSFMIIMEHCKSTKQTDYEICDKILSNFFNKISKMSNKGITDILFWKSLHESVDIYKIEQMDDDYKKDKLDRGANYGNGSHSPIKTEYSSLLDDIYSSEDGYITPGFNKTKTNINNEDVQIIKDSFAAHHNNDLPLSFSKPLTSQSDNRIMNLTGYDDDVKIINPNVSATGNIIDVDIVSKKCAEMIEMGFESILNWLVRNIESEKYQRVLLMLAPDEGLEIIPDIQDTIDVTSPIVISFLECLNFQPPTDDSEDKYWKIPERYDSNILDIIKKHLIATLIC